MGRRRPLWCFSCCGFLLLVIQTGMSSVCIPSDEKFMCQTGPTPPSSSPCVCRLSCACSSNALNATRADIALNCTCDYRSASVNDPGFLFWMTASAAQDTEIAYDVNSLYTTPSLDTHGVVSNVSLAVEDGLQLTPVSADMKRQVVPFNVPPSQNHIASISLGFNYTAIHPGLMGAPPTTFSAGIIPCTIDAFSALAYVNLPPEVSSIQVSWPPLDPAAASVLTVDIEVQNVKNGTNSPFLLIKSISGAFDNTLWAVQARQCEPFRIRSWTRLTMPDFPGSVRCPAASAITEVYVREPPATPAAVTAAVLTHNQVHVTWRVDDTGGCLPMYCFLDVYTNPPGTPLASANITVVREPTPSGDVGDVPTEFGFTITLPEGESFASRGECFVTVSSHTIAGRSSPIASGYFRYNTGTQLPTLEIVSAVAGTVIFAVLLTVVVCCLYRRGIASKLKQSSSDVPTSPDWNNPKAATSYDEAFPITSGSPLLASATRTTDGGTLLSAASPSFRKPRSASLGAHRSGV